MTADTISSVPLDKLCRRNAAGRPHDTVVLVIILLFLNLSVLLKILPLELFILYPHNIDNQWWRIATHLFVHTDVYHFTFDLVSFVILYIFIPESNIYKRISCLAVITLSDVILCILLSKFDWICGLSGLNYGLLTIICCVESNFSMSKSRIKISLPFILLAAIIVKTSVEVMIVLISGHNIHYPFFGYISSESHAGGIMGGLICYFGRREERGTNADA